MKAKMGEIDGKMAIYRRNLGQNSRWNTNLPLKFKSGRWITLLTLESHLGRWINTGVIWAVRSRWREERNISKNSAIYRRFSAATSDYLGKSPIYRFSSIYRRFIGFHRYIADLSAIYWYFLRKIVPPIFLLEMPCGAASRYKIYRRYIADISRYFPPCVSVWAWILGQIFSYITCSVDKFHWLAAKCSD